MEQQTNQIIDMVFVRTLEKRIGRTLTDTELDQDGPFLISLPYGGFLKVSIPRVEFPMGLLSAADTASVHG